MADNGSWSRGGDLPEFGRRVSVPSQSFGGVSPLSRVFCSHPAPFRTGHLEVGDELAKGQGESLCRNDHHNIHPHRQIHLCQRCPYPTARPVAPNRVADTTACDQTDPGVLSGTRGGNHRDRAPLATPSRVQYPPEVAASGERRVGPPLRRRVACGPCHAGSSGSIGRRGYACGDGSRAASCGVGPLVGMSSS